MIFSCRLSMDQQTISAKSAVNQASSGTSKSTKKFPTGLVADWKSKISTRNRDDTQNHQRGSSPLGGLADDDASAKRPEKIENRYKAQRDKVRPIFYFGPDERLLIFTTGKVEDHGRR